LHNDNNPPLFSLICYYCY